MARSSAKDPVEARAYGLGRGKVFPAAHAASLLHPLRRLLQPPARTVARMGLRPADRVLEIGCGPGYFSVELCRAVPAGQVVLFDLQAKMLALAQDRLTRTTNARFAQGDATTLPFGDACFDAVLLVFVLGEVPDRRRCLLELARVVRVGGSVTFVETWRDSDFIRFGRLRPEVESCGFELARRHGWLDYTATFTRRAGTGGS